MKSDISLQSTTSEITHNIEPALEDFQINMLDKKLIISQISGHLIHDDLVEFNDSDELEAISE